MKDANLTDVFDPMQWTFGSFSQVRDAMRQNWEIYWRNQEKILNSMEEMAQDWFERRHVATKTALDAACSMCDAKSPVDMVQSCQSWMMGSIERVAADGLACQKHLMTVAELLSPPRPPVGEAREAEPKRPPVRTRPAEPEARAA